MAAATARTIAARITQPIARTHPHLFAHAGELTPGITAAEYAQRRHRLMAPLNNGDVAVLVGHPTTYTSYSIFNPFHQNTNFLYLTGLDEPDCAVVLGK
ncbi:aminopeptidase [Sorochytrium milnesiophthora]